MPVLTNRKYELVAQGLAEGLTESDAYERAGYKRHDGNAGRCARDPRVQARVAEILAEGAEKAGVTVQRIVDELAKIAFADIRKAVKWRGHLTRESDNPDGGDVLVIKEIVTNHVALVDGDEIDDDTAAAISEISQNQSGGVKLKMHDKLSALEKLGKHLGMFKDQAPQVTVNFVERDKFDREV